MFAFLQHRCSLHLFLQKGISTPTPRRTTERVTDEVSQCRRTLRVLTHRTIEVRSVRRIRIVQHLSTW